MPLGERKVMPITIVPSNILYREERATYTFTVYYKKEKDSLEIELSKKNCNDVIPIRMSLPNLKNIVCTFQDSGYLINDLFTLMENKEPFYRGIHFDPQSNSIEIIIKTDDLQYEYSISILTLESLSNSEIEEKQ